jgi:hypothetical protein
MAEVFYGTWRVRLNHADPDSFHRIKIAGSDNADGTYGLRCGTPFSLDVSGTQWSMSCDTQRISPIPGPLWQPRRLTRASRFDSKEGLTFQLDASGLPRLSLVCVAKDPAINPDQADNPFDFTLPG